MRAPLYAHVGCERWDAHRSAVPVLAEKFPFQRWNLKGRIKKSQKRKRTRTERPNAPELKGYPHQTRIGIHPELTKRIGIEMHASSF